MENTLETQILETLIQQLNDLKSQIKVQTQTILLVKEENTSLKLKVEEFSFALNHLNTIVDPDIGLDYEKFAAKIGQILTERYGQLGPRGPSGERGEKGPIGDIGIQGPPGEGPTSQELRCKPC